MLILLPILILLMVPLVMLAIRAARPKFAFFWLAALLGATPTIPLWIWLRSRVPEEIILIRWEPQTFFPVSPTLLLDTVSWAFVIALSVLLLASLLTDVVRADEANWKAWAGSQPLIALGMIAVLSGNPLTLLLAWTAIDLVELFILLILIQQSTTREQIVAAFSARFAGILLVIWASLASISFGEQLTFTNISSKVSPYLLLAAGLRLGVLPIHQPFLEQLSIRRGLGSLMRLVPAAASLMLLTRTAMAGTSSNLNGLLLFLSGLAALYAGISWVSARDELEGRPHWILGMAAFSVGSAILGMPGASLSWGLTGLLSGMLLFLYSTHHRRLLFLPALGMLGLSTLPLTPGWTGVFLYQRTGLLSGLLFMAAQALFLGGYARIALQEREQLKGVERWVWVIYPFGLLLLPAIHFLVTYWSPTPSITETFPSILDSWPSIVVISLASIVTIGYYRGAQVPGIFLYRLRMILSLRWFYRILWSGYKGVGRAIRLVNTIFEGDGGILWTLLLLVLLFALIVQAGQTG